MKNLITYLKALWSWVSGSQRKKVGVTLGEGAIEHPFSTYSAPFGTCWQPSGKLHSVVRCAAMLVMLFTIGSGNAWGAVETIYQETFGSSGSNIAIASASTYTATTSMFTSGHQTSVVSNYSGSGKVGKKTTNPSDNTGASGNSAVWFTGTKNTTQTVTLFKVENIDISGYTSLKLKFNVKRNDGSNTTNKITVKYKIDSGSEQTLSYTTPSGTGWTWSSDFSLTGTGSSLSITFSHYSTGGYTIRLDDIILSGTAPSGTSVSLTKAGETNGTISLSSAGPLTTTSSTASTTVTASPSAGYYLSNLTASNPSTGTATVTGSGNTRTVTYSSGANGSSTITATFSPIWYLKGGFNSWGDTDPLTTYSAGVATVTKTLDAMTKYEFKMYNAQEAAYYKNTGKIITDISGYDYTSGDGANTFLYTGPAGTYTFKFTLEGKLLQVQYPEVVHPAAGYAYFQKQDSWTGFKAYIYTSDDNRMSDWAGSPNVTNTTNICGTTYYYCALTTDFNNVIFRDNSSNQWKAITTTGYSGKYCGDDYSADPQTWKTFGTYSLTFAGNGNTSGSMTDLAGQCPNSNIVLAANAFAKTDHTFTGWIANVNVKNSSGTTITAGTLITDESTIQITQNTILTAQWTHNPELTVSKSSIAFGDKKVSGSYTETFTVSGSYLKGNIGIAVSGTNSAMFTVSSSTLTPSDGSVATTTITVTYSPTTAASHSATITISSTGVSNKTISLTGIGQYQDTFIDMLQNTTGYTEGSPHTETGTYSTPSLSDKAVATSGTCEQQHYHFVGWITAAKYAAGTAISDGDLQTPTSATNETYYAVWAKQAAGGGGSLTETLTGSEIASHFTSSAVAYGNAEKSYTDGDITWAARFNANAGVPWFQLKSDNAVYLKITAPAAITKLDMNVSNTSCSGAGCTMNMSAHGYSGSNISLNTAADGSGTTVANASPASSYAFSLSPTGSNSTLYLKVSGATRIWSDITVTYSGGVSYEDYKAICCTDWSTPTVGYSSSLAINASEGVTIGSGTTHGDVTYESSDEDVLTVDADGTIHAVGAGTAHITATWAGDATYCEKSANSNDVTVSGIQVTGTTPVNFGQVYQNAVIADKTIYVTGLGLASDITPSLPAGSPFSFSPASLAKDCSGATLTISASTATLGTYNQTLTLTSGAFSTTVTVKMEVIAKPTATFTDALHGLTEDEDGVSLSSYNLTAAQGTPVVFPTLANQTKSAGTCEGEYYIFVGWTEGDNNTDPEDHLVTSYTLANGDTKNYYAVWADASGSATYTKLTTNTFKTAPTKYVLGAEHEGTTYYFSYYDPTEIAYDLDWGTCSSSDAPIQFTLSGTAAELVVKDNLNNYLEAPCTTKAFYISDTETTVELKSDGTIYNNGDGCTSYRLRYNYNSGSGGLRWYTSDTGDPAYFYLVGAAGTVHYRTSCCANKVDAPVVTATTVTSTSITLTWPSDDKATGWQIEWNGAGGWVTPSGSCTHTVSGLTPNTTYTWRVRATYEDPVCGADVRSGSTTTNQVYHVTYAKGSGTGTCTAEGSTTDATGYEAGATVTLQENGFTLAGHTFAGWTEDDEDITISSNQFTMPDHDVVITASWTAKMDKYFDRMHDQTDELHGGVEETEGTNEGKYYIPKEGCNYSIPTAVDSNTGDACQTSHYKLQGWIAASHMKGYPDHMTGEIKSGEETYIFPPTGTKTATGATYYAIWAEVTE